MPLINKEIKFSSKIQIEDSFNVFKKNHDFLITEVFYFQQQWLTAAFKRFKDFDKYIILIYLINKAFKGYNDHFIVNSFDEFYSKENFEIPKINIIDLGGGNGEMSYNILQTLNDGKYGEDHTNSQSAVSSLQALTDYAKEHYINVICIGQVNKRYFINT